MNIYKKLPLDLQLLIVQKIKKEYANNILFPSIIHSRKNLIKNKLLNLKYLKNDFNYWFNMFAYEWGSYSLKERYIKFFKNLLPGIDKLDNLNYIYLFYKGNSNASFKDFLNFCFDNLNVESLEDLNNYINFIEYHRYVNKCNLIE